VVLLIVLFLFYQKDFFNNLHYVSAISNMTSQEVFWNHYLDVMVGVGCIDHDACVN